jgi:hypothetical protein
MCRLGRTAGSAAEMSDVHCGVSDFVDGSNRGDARGDAPTPNAGDFVPGLGAFARRPVGGGTDLRTPGIGVRTLCKGIPHVPLARAEESL